MSATLSAGVNSVILKLDTPYDTIRTTDIRDDLIKVKVWCSTTSGFTPSDSNLVFNALSLSIVISKLTDGTDLVAGTTYYVKYAYISDIDETVYTVSSQLSATPIVASAQTVDISGYSAFVKSTAGVFTPTTTTLTAVLNGITSPVYAWTITGGTLSASNTASVIVTPAANATSVTVTLSVTGTGLTTPIVKSVVMAVVSDGQNATAYGLVVSAGAIQKTKAGTLNPTTITVYGYSAVGATTPGLYSGRFKIYENGSATASYTSTTNESMYTYTPSSANITSLKAELYLAGGTVNKVDEQSIPVVVDGTDTITAVLSNESATVPADSTGTVTSFAGANTTMTVYVGATDDSANWTYSVTKSNVTCTEATTSRTQTVTALSAVSGYVDITASKSGYSSITKRFNINKSLNGAQGPTGPTGGSPPKYATAYLYQWASTASTPTGTSTYTWATATNSAYSAGDGWSTTVPTNPGTPLTKLWTATKSVSDSATATTTTIDWTTGALVGAISQNGAFGVTGATGASGSNGINTITLRVYKPALTIPSGPTGTSTYTWSTSTLTAPTDTSWTLSPPASSTGLQGQTLWAATITITDAATSTSTTVNWTSSAIVAQSYYATNGATGPTGSSGPTGSNGPTGATGSGTQGISARVAYAVTTGTPASTPANLEVTGDIVPTTGTWFTGVTWQTNSPASLTAGQYLYQVDGLYNPATGKTNWIGVPYLSALKVGSLSAITANTGALTVTDNITVTGNGTDGVLITTSGISIYNAGVLRVKLGSI